MLDVRELAYTELVLQVPQRSSVQRLLYRAVPGLRQAENMVLQLKRSGAVDERLSILEQLLS